MSPEQEKPIVIIGTGLSGYSLAREFRKLDKDTPVLMITRDDGHSYSKPMLSTGFTKNKDADALSMGDAGKMADQLQISVRTFTEVTGIDIAQKEILLGSERLAFDKLVLASGARVNRLEFPGSDHARVVSINDLMDYRAFREKLAAESRVLIMGAGLIGCEYANDLLSGGFDVTVVDPSSSALSGLIPDFAGHALIKGLENTGARFFMQHHVTDIREDGEALVATLNDGQTLSADIVISAVGLKPDLQLAEDAGIECNRGIVVNRYLETSADDVYALGDAAEVDGHVLLYVLPLMACAKALARTLSGEATAVSYGVMPVATKTPACPVIVYPPPKGAEGCWQKEQDGQNIKAVFEDKAGQPLGYVLTGDCIAEKQSLSKRMPPILG